MTDSFDVAVAGAGPAGTTAARLLAQRGHRVLLISRPRPTPSLAESIPPSAGKLLDHLNWRDAVDAGGFIRSSGNTVFWGEEDRQLGDGRPAWRVERYDDGLAGYQVDRGSLDRLLLRALNGGVAMVRGTVTDVVDRLVRFSAAGAAREISAEWILDCSGRVGVASRRLGRREVGAARTLALTALWSRPNAWPVPDPTHTLVESYASGWGWSVPLTARRRQVTVMVDPHLTRLSLGGGKDELERVYHRELARLQMLHAVTRGARVIGAPFARDASPYFTERAAAGGVLLVGDAASFIDPLSSYGIKKALASAWLAAVVTHSCLTSPAIETAALELYQSRERAMYDALESQRLALVHDALSGTAMPALPDFWSARLAADGSSTEGERGGVWSLDAVRRDKEVLAAFEDLKRSGNVALRPAAELRRIDRADVVDGRVELIEHLVTSAVPEGIRYVRNIDLIAVLDAVAATPRASPPDLYESYCRSVRPVPLGDFLGALALLIGKRALTFS
ncbi:MAG: NAD(P)/FAD-dependent oxidoreductase [Gemmatimonadaceae bacterium]